MTPIALESSLAMGIQAASARPSLAASSSWDRTLTLLIPKMKTATAR